MQLDWNLKTVVQNWKKTRFLNLNYQDLLSIAKIAVPERNQVTITMVDDRIFLHTKNLPKQVKPFTKYREKTIYKDPLLDIESDLF